MHKGRLEAFTDAVIAIILTIMVLELRPPENLTAEALRPLGLIFLSYALSFVYLAIYWNNHHHMFQSVERINGAVLWANMHLLFWLSLTPFATAWLGEHPSTASTAGYGVVLLLCAISYYILVLVLVRVHGKNSHFARALGNDFKGKLSPVIYAAGIGLAFVWPIVSYATYIAVALMWLVPDKRFEHKVSEDPAEH